MEGGTCISRIMSAAIDPISVFSEYLSKKGVKHTIPTKVRNNESDEKVEVFVDFVFHLLDETLLRDIVQTALQTRDINAAKG